MAGIGRSYPGEEEEEEEDFLVPPAGVGANYEISRTSPDPGAGEMDPALAPRGKRLQVLELNRQAAEARLAGLRQEQEAAQKARQAEYEAAQKEVQDWKNRGWYAKGSPTQPIWERFDEQGNQLPAPTPEEAQAHEQAGRDAQRRHAETKRTLEAGLPGDEKLKQRMVVVEDARADLEFRTKRLSQGLPEVGLKRWKEEEKARLGKQAKEEELNRKMDEALAEEQRRAKSPPVYYPSPAELGFPEEKGGERTPAAIPYLTEAKEREARKAQAAQEPVFLRIFQSPEEMERVFRRGADDHDAALALAADDEQRKTKGERGPEPERAYWLEPPAPPRPVPPPVDAAEALERHREMLGGLKDAGRATAEARARGFIAGQSRPLAPGVSPKMIANQLFYEWATRSPLKDQEHWPEQRSALARGLGWQGKPGEVISDEAFYDLAGTHLRKRAADQTKSEQIYHKAQLAALQGRSYEDTLREAKALTGGREADFEPVLQAGRDSITRMLGDEAPLKAIAPLYQVITRGLRQEGIESLFTPAALAGFQAYAGQKHQGRQAMFAGLDFLAREDQYTVEDLAERLGDAMKESHKRVMDRLTAHSLRAQAEGIAKALKYGRIWNRFAPGQIPPASDFLKFGGQDWSSMGNEMDGLWGDGEGLKKLYRSNRYRALLPREREEMQERMQAFRGMADFLADATVMAPRVKQDLDSLRHTGLLDWAGDTLVAMGGSATELALSAAPNGAGLYALGIAGYEGHLARLREQYADVPESQLAPRAALAAALETGLSRVQVLTLGARLPAVRAALMKYGVSSTLGTKVLGTAVAVAGGTAMQPIQNSALEISEQLFSAVKKDLPGPEWDKVVAREKAALGDYASVNMAMTLVIGLGRGAVRAFDGEKLRTQLSNRRGLELTGVGRKQAEEIAAIAEQGDIAGAAERLKQAAEALPVEQRRMQAREVQEQVLQEQQQGGEDTTRPGDAGLKPKTAVELPQQLGKLPPRKAPKDLKDFDDGPPAFEIPADRDPEFLKLGWKGETNSAWADPEKIQHLIDQTDAAGHFKPFDEGAESEVYPLGKNWVLKVVNGFIDRTLPGWAQVRYDQAALMDRVAAIRKLGGLETYAMVSDDGKLLIIQERGSKISHEEYKTITLDGGVKPADGSKMIVTIGGRRFYVSDLHEGNFLKDRNGVIRVSDLLAGEIQNATTPLWQQGNTPPSVNSKDK